MHSFDTALATPAALALGMLALTTAFHHQALRLLARAVNGSRVTQQWVVAVLVALVGVHLAEVALYGGGNAVGVNMFALGGLRGSSGNAALDFSTSLRRHIPRSATATSCRLERCDWSRA
jgi:hypothetical protein